MDLRRTSYICQFSNSLILDINLPALELDGLEPEGCGGDTVPPTSANSQILDLVSLLLHHLLAPTYVHSAWQGVEVCAYGNAVEIVYGG